MTLAVRDALKAAVADCLAEEAYTASQIEFERPSSPTHGDWSTNIALAAAKALGRTPRDLALDLAAQLGSRNLPHVLRVEVAGPGFLNFYLAPSWLQETLREVLSDPSSFATFSHGRGKRVMVEFVSANPTGPIHVGNGWFASYGDSISRLLARCGFEVSREYYVNDTGLQVERLGQSVLARRDGEAVPEDGYASGFIKGIGSCYEGPDDAASAGTWAAERVLRFIRHQMTAVNVEFDEWYSQASIETGPDMAETMGALEASGRTFESEGAIWLDTRDFGDKREKRVLKRSPEHGGAYTYLAGDIAYHRNKFLKRGFDHVINVWGADHAGQVPSLKAAMAILGIEASRLEIRIGQMVSLAGGRMGKRLGNAVDLDDLVGEIGPDAMRILSLMSSLDQAATIDLDAIRSESKDSPIYYIQYAYARIASIKRAFEERSETVPKLPDLPLELLVHQRETELIRTISELPDVILIAAKERAPHRVAHWLRTLADNFHGFYHDCPVLKDVRADGRLTELGYARLGLIDGVQIALGIGLDVLGVTAPERM